MPSLRMFPLVVTVALSWCTASCTSRQPGQPPAQAAADAPAPPPKPLGPSVEAPAHAPAAAPPVVNAPAQGGKSIDCPAKRPEMCTQQYQPVCANVDTGVRCIKAPCPSGERREFSNWCVACTNPKVTSYVDGPCPGSGPRPSPESMPQ